MLFSGLVMGLKSLEIARKYIYISENQNRVKSPKNGLKTQARFPGCWWAGFLLLFSGLLWAVPGLSGGAGGLVYYPKQKSPENGLASWFYGQEKNRACFARFVSGFIS